MLRNLFICLQGFIESCILTNHFFYFSRISQIFKQPSADDLKNFISFNGFGILSDTRQPVVQSDKDLLADFG